VAELEEDVAVCAVLKEVLVFNNAPVLEDAMYFDLGLELFGEDFGGGEGQEG
jgi:hypothetical protein